MERWESTVKETIDAFVDFKIAHIKQNLNVRFEQITGKRKPKDKNEDLDLMCAYNQTMNSTFVSKMFGSFWKWDNK